MKKGYWIVRADITNIERFKEYASRTPEAIQAFGGHFLIRAGKSTLVEGDTRSRNTVIEFPSFQAALDCWESDLYQNAKHYRIDAAVLDIVVIEGV